MIQKKKKKKIDWNSQVLVYWQKIKSSFQHVLSKFISPKISCLFRHSFLTFHCEKYCNFKHKQFWWFLMETSILVLEKYYWQQNCLFSCSLTNIWYETWPLRLDERSPYFIIRSLKSDLHASFFKFFSTP